MHLLAQPALRADAQAVAEALIHAAAASGQNVIMKALIVVQIRAQHLTRRSADNGSKLGQDYHRVMRLWFLLGWPAFLGLWVPIG